MNEMGLSLQGQWWFVLPRAKVKFSCENYNFGKLVAAPLSLHSK